MKNWIIILFLTLLFGCASSGDVNYLNERVIELENRLVKVSKESLSELNEKSQKIEKSSEKQRENYAELNAQVDQLRTLVFKQKGQIEELEFFLKKVQGELKSLNSLLEQTMVENRNLNKRFYKIEQYVGFEPVKNEDLKKIDSKDKDQNLSEKDLYSLAKANFDKGNMKEARDLFNKFLEQYPKSPNADNAQFWISDIYYIEKWYEKAILEYQKVIEKYPNGNKIPASYLKQGYAFYNLGEKANAKLILNELIKNYPGTNEAKLARKKLAQIK